MSASLCDRAVAILNTADPVAKVDLSLSLAADWQQGRIEAIGAAIPPLHPARPDRPEILPPNRMKRRGTGGGKARLALLHALAHIEFNAIDLAWDIIARFTGENLPRRFYDDWVQVAADEAEHFAELQRQMAQMGGGYGDLAAHGGLWEAAVKTADSLAARLALVPMTLEARALDTAPNSIARMDPDKDADSISGLTGIVHDEISHVAAGVRWFCWLCARDGQEPASRYQALVRPHFPYGLKPPFNDSARQQAGLSADFYQPLAQAAAVQ